MVNWSIGAGGQILVQLPAGAKLGQYEVRVRGTVPTVTRDHTRRLFGSQLRSGRTLWASGLHHRTIRDVHGIQPWERDLGRWSDLVLRPSVDPNQGWGDPAGKPGDPGLAWNLWAFNGLSMNQFGSATVVGMSIYPHNIGVDHDTPAQGALHRDIAAGKYDWVYRQIATNMKAWNLGQAIVRIDWEANGTWYKHGTQRIEYAADHGRAVAHVIQVMKSVAPGLRFSLDVSSHVWMPSSDGKTWLETYNPQAYAPAGQKLIDLILCDFYFFYDRNIGPNPSYDQFTSMLYKANAGVTLGLCRDFSRAHDLPLAIGEWGLVNKVDQYGNDTGKNGTGDAPVYIEHMHRFCSETETLAYEAYWILGDWSVHDLQTDLRTLYPASYEVYRQLWGAAAS